MRACAEMAESAVPAMETPRLPRKNTKDQLAGNAEDRHVVQDGEDGKHQKLCEQEKKRVGG